MRKLCIIFAIAIIACSGKPGPKDVVFDFIDAVLTSDSLRVMDDLDLDEYVKSLLMEMSPEDSALAISEHRQKTIKSLLGDGDTRSRWLRQQIVVNEAFVADNLAEVEVSFIDQASGHMVYTKMQLKKQPDDTWKIIFFR
jgi:hypothetical protein